jgi:hypothetical protein
MALPTLSRLVTLAIVLGLGVPAMAAGNFYCCVDTNGKQMCGDLLPQGCYGRAYRELGPNGQTLRNVEAPLTAEQRAARSAEEAQRKVEEANLREKQRKDQALLNTYGSEKDIEMMRLRAQSDVQKSINGAETRIAEIRTERKIFENEAEFYRKKKLPPEVQKGLRDADYAIKVQENLIESKKKELDMIRIKYDEDLSRFQEIARRKPSAR